LEKELCLKVRNTKQRYFYTSSGYLYYKGIKSVEDFNIYEKDSKKELGKGRAEAIGSWTVEYSKK
jgi:hypothetical protein